MIKVADVTPQDSSPSAEKGIQKYCTGAWCLLPPPTPNKGCGRWWQYFLLHSIKALPSILLFSVIVLGDCFWYNHNLMYLILIDVGGWFKQH
jgi:hypothetical protein